MDHAQDANPSVSKGMTLVDKLDVTLDEQTRFELRKDEHGYHVCIADPDGTTQVIDRLNSKHDDAAKKDFSDYVRDYARDAIRPIRCREPFSEEEE